MAYPKQSWARDCSSQSGVVSHMHRQPLKLISWTSQRKVRNSVLLGPPFPDVACLFSTDVAEARGMSCLSRRSALEAELVGARALTSR